MSEVAVNIKSKVRSEVVTLVGCRIDNFTRGENGFFTEVTVPAPDAFDKPSVYKIRSRSVIGQKGDFVDLDCKLSGYIKVVYFEDKETKEKKEYRNDVVFFNLIEQG